MKHTLRLAAAALAAVALAMIGTAVPTANAADTPNPGIIDTSHPVTLSVYKYLGSPTTMPNNGTQQTVTGLEALSGIKFYAYKVTQYSTDGGTTLKALDLTKNAGWDAAAAVAGHIVTPTEISNGYFDQSGTRYYLGSAIPSQTDTSGLAYFSSTVLSGIGLYLVNEDLAGSTPIQSCTSPTVCTTLTDNQKSQISPVNPFFVTLPMTQPADSGTNALTSWMYDVFVYPKNQLATGDKAVTDWKTQTMPNGPDAVTFAISTPITDGMTATEMKMYQVIDQLDPRLTYQSLTVKIDGDGNTATTGDQTLLTPTTDYTITNVSGKITVNLTSAGIAQLVVANDGDPTAVPPKPGDRNATVLTTITANITGTIGDGSIENTASFIPNQAFYDSHGGTGTDTNTVTSYYGNLNITKKDPRDATVKMPGAEFAVYIDPTPALGSDANTCTAEDVNSGKTAVATGTTDANGLLTISGLQTSDWYNGAAQTDLIWYCLVETKAPAGYNLNAEPISFKIEKATAATPAHTDLTVNNAKKNLGNALPLTGGQGVAVLSIGGALLVGAGLGYYLVFLRRHRNAQ